MLHRPASHLSGGTRRMSGQPPWPIAASGPVRSTCLTSRALITSSPLSDVMDSQNHGVR